MSSPFKKAASTSKACSIQWKVAAMLNNKCKAICGAVGASFRNLPKSWSRCPGTTILERGCVSWPGCSFKVLTRRARPGRILSRGIFDTSCGGITSIASLSSQVCSCFASALSNHARSSTVNFRGFNSRVPLPAFVFMGSNTFACSSSSSSRVTGISCAARGGPGVDAEGSWSGSPR